MVLPSGNVVVKYFQSWLLFLHCFRLLFIHLLEGMMLCCLTASYKEARRTIFLDDCWIPFAWRTAVVSSVLISCTLIGSTFWCAIVLVSSDLDPEETWTEATHAWVLVAKSGGLRGGVDFSYKVFLSDVAGGHLKFIPHFHQYWVHVVRLETIPIIHHPRCLGIIVIVLATFLDANKCCRNYVEAGTKRPKRPKLSSRAKNGCTWEKYLLFDWDYGANIWVKDFQEVISRPVKVFFQINNFG